MSFTDILSTIFEFILVAFTIWAVFNENKFIIIEEKLFCNIKRKRLKIAKHNEASLCTESFKPEPAKKGSF